MFLQQQLWLSCLYSDFEEQVTIVGIDSMKLYNLWNPNIKIMTINLSLHLTLGPLTTRWMNWKWMEETWVIYFPTTQGALILGDLNRKCSLQLF